MVTFNMSKELDTTHSDEINTRLVYEKCESNLMLMLKHYCGHLNKQIVVKKNLETNITVSNDI